MPLCLQSIYEAPLPVLYTKDDAMLRLIGYSAKWRLLLAVVLLASASVAVAAEKSSTVPLQSMSDEEYAIYREQLQQRVKKAEAKNGQPSPVSDEEVADKEKEASSGSGYGRGYRSRMDRGSRAGGGTRGGAMNRGGGHGR